MSGFRPVQIYEFETKHPTSFKEKFYKGIAITAAALTFGGFVTAGIREGYNRYPLVKEYSIDDSCQIMPNSFADRIVNQKEGTIEKTLFPILGELEELGYQLHCAKNKVFDKSK